MPPRFKLIPETHLVITQGTDVLLLRRFNTGYADGQYSLVAGHIEEGESAIQATSREAHEEAGIAIDPNDVVMFHVMHRLAEESRMSLFFTTKRWQGTPHNAEPHKCDDMRWAPINAMPDNTIKYVQQALMLGFDGVRYSEFGW